MAGLQATALSAARDAVCEIAARANVDQAVAAHALAVAVRGIVGGAPVDHARLAALVAALEERVEKLENESDRERTTREIALHAPPDALLTRTEAQALLNIGKTTFYNLIAKGEIPEAIMTPGGKRWLKTDLEKPFKRLR